MFTSGTFDGLHLGHKKIIHRLIETAKKTNGESVVITFWPHPRLILAPDDSNLKLLSTLDEKIALFADTGIDHLIILAFTREFSELSSEQYLIEVLVKAIGTKTLVIGYDHRFGRNREGGFDYLQKHASKFNLQIEEISKQEIDNLTISSTKIREALQQGEIAAANELLGRAYSFEGLVKKGRQLGRTIGFPTANVHISKKYKMIPANGVYAVRVELRQKQYIGVMNIGNRPTVDGVGITQEVHILNFNDDIYGEILKVEVMAFIRPEERFESIEKLVYQIQKDCQRATELID